MYLFLSRAFDALPMARRRSLRWFYEVAKVSFFAGLLFILREKRLEGKELYKSCRCT